MKSRGNFAEQAAEKINRHASGRAGKGAKKKLINFLVWPFRNLPEKSSRRNTIENVGAGLRARPLFPGFLRLLRQISDEP